MCIQQISATTILSPVSPVGSSLSFARLTGIFSAIAPIALISLLLRSRRK